MQTFLEFRQPSFTGKVYHGSNMRFSEFSQDKARIQNDFYGGGVAYFTDDLKTAINYAKGMAKKGGEPLVYIVQIKLQKIFDVDDIYSGKDLINILPHDLDEFARGAKLLKAGGDTLKVLRDLREGNIELTGDQIFKGLSKGMTQTAKARRYLMNQGFDGLRYNGGVNMNMKRHSVYLAYYAKSLEVIKRKKAIKKETR